MTIRSRVPHVFVLGVLGVFMFPNNAFAYLDPNTGSLVIQSVIAAIAASAYGVRLYWGKIRSLFTGRAGESAAGAERPGVDQR